MSPNNEGKRKKLIQLIHIAKSKAKMCSKCGNLYYIAECPGCGQSNYLKIPDEAYREILFSLVLKNSTTQMTLSELITTLSFFQDCGFVVKNKPFNVNKELEQEKERVRKAIIDKALDVLGDNYQTRLDGILKYIGRESIEFCNMKDLRRIHGFISSIQKKERINEQK